MLKQLYIRNLALVDELSIDFDTGMTVISGETGAGKSMLLNALGLALGDRFNSSLLAADRQSGQVVAYFSVDNVKHPALQWLIDKDLSDGTQCLLRRSFSVSGNRCYVNNVQVTQSQMSHIGDLLVELHGQHQHHSLLRQPVQAQLFDSYCQQLPLSHRIERLYRQKKALALKVQTMEESQKKADNDRQYFVFQLQELEDLAPIKGEYRQLDTKQKQLSMQQQLTELIEKLSDWLEGNDSGNVTGALTFVSQINRLLTHMPFDGCRNIAQIFEQIEMQLGEASLQLQNMRNQEPLDHEQINQLEQRFSQWHTLARKHGVDPNKIPDVLEDFRCKINNIDNCDQRLEELKEKLDNISKQHQQACDQLTYFRQCATDSFATAVTELIQGLAMQEASFHVDLQQQAIAGAQGNEKVNFVIRTNPGSEEAPLDAIVSGGELSRISLAIHKSCYQTKQHSRCMIFDEIDVGMSGIVAELTGKLLHSLGSDSQVICVTHQPQVAARAHHHILASKKHGSQAVCIDLRSLNMQESVEEIARMLGSDGTKQQSLDLAQEMYRLGHA